MNEAALAAAIGGSLVGLAGIALTGLNSAKDRKHQRRLAAEARIYSARATTYVDLLITLGRMLRSMDAAHPESQAIRTREARQQDRIEKQRSQEDRIKELLASREEHLRIEAQLTAFGSVAVRDAAREFFAAEEHYADKWIVADEDRWEALTAPLADARRALEKVGSLVRDELAAYTLPMS